MPTRTHDVANLGDALVALAIGATGEDQRHIGVLYRSASTDPPRFLHLAWHLNLSDDESVPEGFRGVLLSDVPVALQRTIVAECKRSAAADTLAGLPYGFGYQPTLVERAGDDRMVLRGPSGLTCATFVLAIFDLASVSLADLDSWQDRCGDQEWKDHIIATLAKTRWATEQHIEAVRRDKDRVRIRPEDAAGCASATPLPAGFAHAVAEGTAILEELGSSAA
jgi:hypothetical protein